MVQVFKLNNFFDVTEADTLIENALGLTDPNNKLKRSTTGQGEGKSSSSLPHGSAQLLSAASPCVVTHDWPRLPLAGGAAAQQDPHRTSENAWDMTSPVALKLKRRIFELLGIRPYMDNWADGIQVGPSNISFA